MSKPIIDTADLVVWQIPGRDEDPSEELIEWLHQHDHEQWEGDGEGIVLYDSSGEVLDTVFQGGFLGSYRITDDHRVLRKWIPREGVPAD